MVFHMLHHVPKYIKMFGPVWTHWMFTFERGVHTLIESTTNMKSPEVTSVKRLEVIMLSEFI